MFVADVDEAFALMGKQAEQSGLVAGKTHPLKGLLLQWQKSELWHARRLRVQEGTDLGKVGHAQT